MSCQLAGAFNFNLNHLPYDFSPEKHRGVRLSKDIVKVAGRAMEKNFTTLGPYVLPMSEQLKTGFWMLVRFLAKKINYKVNLR